MMGARSGSIPLIRSMGLTQGSGSSHRGNPHMLETLRDTVSTALVILLAACSAAFAEAQTVRVSRGYGITHLPLYVIESEKLFEKHAKAAGLGDITVTWRELDGGGNLNDAMIAGTLDI